MTRALLDHVAAVGRLLRYPAPAHAAAAAALRDALAPSHPEPARAVAAHHDAVARLDAAAREEAYTRSFDLQPVCAPYLSVHLFGEESFQRAVLMAGLAEAWQRTGFDPRGELPDHVGVALEGGPRLPTEEWQELARFCLLPSLAKMAAALGATNSPWAPLCQAAQALVGAASGLDAAELARIAAAATRKERGHRSPALALEPHHA